MSEVQMVEVKRVLPNPYNPRKEFEPGAISELARSIEAVGIIQPLVVYPAGSNGKKYVLCGDRRLRAAKEAKLREIPCVVIEPPETEAQAVALALVENMQREDLSTSEMAVAVKSMIEAGVKQKAVSTNLGVTVHMVTTLYQLARFEDVLEAFKKGGEEYATFWASVGRIETENVREAVISAIQEDRRYGYDSSPSGFQEYVNEIRRLEKRDPEGLADRTISGYEIQVEETKQNVSICQGGYGEDRFTCKHMCEVSHFTSKVLGIEGANAVCLNSDRACLLYKRDREQLVKDKAVICKRTRLLKSESRWNFETNKYMTRDMKEKSCGGKGCKRCKSFFSVPQSFRYGRPEYHFEQPWEYCLDGDGGCYAKKLETYKAQNLPPSPGSRTVSGMKELSDEEVQEILLKDLEGADCERCWRAKNCILALKKRGYVVKVTHGIEVEKVEQEDEAEEAV